MELILILIKPVFDLSHAGVQFMYESIDFVNDDVQYF